MKSDWLIKQSVNRMEKIPIDSPVPVPFDCSMHMPIGPLSLCLYCIGKESSCNFLHAAFT